ncbi:hypothetical protein [Zavarzinia sp. CC-PAN008]|uniref:hypothetical protein n=1 Tax=Zavarzinia sp. CC-PAN008 TaxID=3243332 RepID=UPI003F7473FA
MTREAGGLSVGDGPAPSGLRRLSFYAGLFVISAAMLMLQIAETRLFSVITWYYVAFLNVSMAMFGLTSGALHVHRLGAIDPASLAGRLANAAAGFGLTAALAVVIQTSVIVTEVGSVNSIVSWIALAGSAALPFYFAGIAVSLALTRSGLGVGTVYAVDLVGAAVGCLAVILLLDYLDGASALLGIAAAGAIAAVLFAAGGPVPRGQRARLAALAVVLVAATVANQASRTGLRPQIVKGVLEIGANRPVFEDWNSHSRISGGAPFRGPAEMWGPSPHLVPLPQVEMRSLIIDGSAGTAMYRFDGTPESVSYLLEDISGLAYVVPGRRTAAVIGVGGGRDVLTAKLSGIAEVTGVELNAIFIRLLTATPGFTDFAGIAALPGVTLVVDEARSWFARTTQRFDIIQMSLIDTWAATGVGAFTLSENGLYTVEGWTTFLDHLAPSGLFTVSRWYSPGYVDETGRMISIAVSSLHARGVTRPADHLFMATTGHIATLVMSPQPLAATDLDALQRAARDKGFKVEMAPGRPPDSALLAAIVASPDDASLLAAVRDSFLDLTPSTDSRPFFFNMLRLDRLGELIAHRDRAQAQGVWTGNLIATLTLIVLVAISLLFVVLVIVDPLRQVAPRSGWGLAGGGTLYFAAIGTGFMLVEIALLQRLGTFLGHPVYALSVVLFSLILATGIGSAVSERVRLVRPVHVALWAALTVLYVATLPLWLPGLLAELVAQSFMARAAACIAVLFPGGFLMGMAFPTGMRLVTARDASLTPWLWGINGAAGVLAAGMAVLISLGAGINATMWVGAACYVLTIPAALLILRGRAPRPA